MRKSLDVKNLEHIKPLSWEEVFARWENEESLLPNWIEHYKSRGFSSWAEWRTHSFHDLHPENLSWDLYKVSKPAETVSEFYAGPFRSWIKKYYDAGLLPQFKELVKDLGLQKVLAQKELFENFPKRSLLIGLLNKDRIIIVDGMHRACALALTQAQDTAVETEIEIALAEFPGELPLLGSVDSPT